MKIQIIGASWQKYVLLHAASIFFAKKLGYGNKKRLRLSIKLVPSLVHRQKFRGAAYQDSKKSFQIKLDAALKPISLVKCLAHEMVHVQQWLSGQMEDLFKTRYQVRWGKRVYSPAKLAYQRHPWEIQAHKVENNLYKCFVMFWDSK